MLAVNRLKAIKQKKILRHKNSYIDIAPEIITEYSKIFDEAVEKSLENIKEDTDLYRQFRRELTENVQRFAGYKTHRLIKETVRILKPKTTDQDFYDLHRKINGQWTQTEYNYAIASGQMAGKWFKFERLKQTHYLKYSTAHDERVRPAHKKLDGITLPVDDPFWDKYYPPNGWGCRCNVVSVRKKDTTPTDSQKANQLGDKYALTVYKDDNLTIIDKKATAKMKIFAFNPGKKRQVFPQKHPYFQTKPNLDNQIKLITRNYDKYKDKFNQALSLTNTFIYGFNWEKGTYTVVHKNHNFDPNTGWSELATAGILNQHKYDVIFVEERRDRHYNIDALINGKTAEIKLLSTPKTNAFIRKIIENKRAEIIIIYSQYYFDINNLKHRIHGLKDKISAEFLFYIYNDNLTIIKIKNADAV